MSFDLRAALTKLRNVLAAVAPITPLKTDDELVVFIDAILADAELFGFVAKKVDDHNSGTLQLTAAPPSNVAQALERHKIDWARLVELLPTLITVVKLFV